MKRMKAKGKGEKKNKGGRPSKFTPEIQDRICELITEGAFKVGAAKGVGIAYKTMRAWELENQDFCAAIKKAEEAREHVLLAMIKLAGAEDWKALAWILERTRPDKYSLVARSRDDIAEVEADSRETISLDVTIPSGKSVAVVFRQESSVKEINRAVDDTGPKDQEQARA